MVVINGLIIKSQVWLKGPPRANLQGFSCIRGFSKQVAQQPTHRELPGFLSIISPSSPSGTGGGCVQARCALLHSPQGSQTGLGAGFREGSPASGFMSPTPISHPWTSGHCSGLRSEVDSLERPSPAGAQGKLQWVEEVPVQRRITGQTS